MVSTSCAMQSLEGLFSVVKVQMEEAITNYGSKQILTMRIKARSDGLSRNRKTVLTSYGIASLRAFSSVAMATTEAITGAGSNKIPTTKTEARSAGASNHRLMAPTNYSMSSGEARFSVLATKKVMATVE